MHELQEEDLDAARVSEPRNAAERPLNYVR
jgi:hypothetical protein